MWKVGLWLGMPSLITFLASSNPLRLQNTLVVFVACALAVATGVVPGRGSKSRR